MSKVSIKDVAKYAGVSISTVSRVLHQYKNVPEETRNKVLAAVRELNYTPNYIAQSMTRGRTKNIGVVFSTSAENAFVDPFYPEVLRGIGHKTQNYGYYIQLLAFDDPIREKEECLKLLQCGRVDGLILLKSRMYDSLIYELNKNNHKFVLIGQVSDEYPINGTVYSVDTDNKMGSYKLVSYLIQKGHKRIAFIMGNREHVVDNERYKGYRLAHMDAGLECDPELVIESPTYTHELKDVIKDKLRKIKGITAIFARDDMKAVAAMFAVSDLGLRVPEDVVVAGYNNYLVSTLIEPKLTTVNVPVYDLGVQAAQLMIDLIEGRKIKENRIILPVELIERRSTG